MQLVQEIFPAAAAGNSTTRGWPVGFVFHISNILVFLARCSSSKTSNCCRQAPRTNRTHGNQQATSMDGVYTSLQRKEVSWIPHASCLRSWMPSLPSLSCARRSTRCRIRQGVLINQARQSQYCKHGRQDGPRSGSSWSAVCGTAHTVREDRA